MTVGRALTDTFAGIAPASVPGFVAAQVVGAVLAVGLLVVLYPGVGRVAGEVVVPHETTAHPHRAPRPDERRHRIGRRRLS